MTHASSPPDVSSTPRRAAYRAAVILLLVAGAGMLWAAASVWVRATASPAGLPQVTVASTGREVAPAVGAAGIVALAGIAGVWATRGRWRTLIGVLLLVVIGWAGASATTFGMGLPESAEAAIAADQGFVPADLLSTEVTGWWVLAVAAAALGIAGATLVATRGAAWSAMGDQYSRGKDATTAMTSAQVWDALDRGEDPTIDPEVSQ